MKILVFSQYFYPENFRINTICKELVARGHHITVVTAYPQYPAGKLYDGYGFHIPYEKQWNGVTIHRVKTYPRGSNPFTLLRNCTSYVSSANQWVKNCDEKFDVVFVFGVSPVTVGLPAVTYHEKFGTPIYFYLQDLWPESVHEILGIRFPPLTWAINRIVTRIYEESYKILCTSPEMIPHLQNKGVPKEKLLYWPQFCSAPNLEGAEKPAIYSNNTFNIVFAGNLGNAQGLDLMVNAAKELKDRPIRWFLVGDGRAKERLVRKVKQLHLQDRITFLGRVSEEEANRYVHFADCAYLSFQDSPLLSLIIPAKLQTYLACGTPVLVAANGSVAELVKNAGCGIAVPPELNALVSAAKTLLASSNRQNARYRQAAKAYSLAHFDKDALLDRLEEIIVAEGLA